ncbi:MAG: type II secretion system protein [Candidatus Omnitrophica bacterium]|nr:type II secretion system protein [Candidatus Omnitrophota bacterium]
MNKNKRKQAFTLMETLVATLIMATVLGSMAFSLSHFTRTITDSASQDKAISAARKKIEEILNHPVEQIMNTYNGQTFNVTGLTPDPAGKVTINEIAFEELYDLNVTVSWNERGNPATQTIETSIANY